MGLLNRTNRSRVHNGKPRGARSAYNFFFRDSQVLVAGKSCGRAKMVAEKWRTVDVTKRRHYAQLATQDKLRYGLELVQWKQSVQQQEQEHQKQQEQVQRPAMKFSDSPQDVRPTTNTEGVPGLMKLRRSKGSFDCEDSLADTSQINASRTEKPWPSFQSLTTMDQANDPLHHRSHWRGGGAEDLKWNKPELIYIDEKLNHCGKPYVTDGEGSCGDTAHDTDRVDEPYPIVDAFPLDPENDPLVHPGRLSHLAQKLGPQGVSAFVKLFLGRGCQPSESFR